MPVFTIQWSKGLRRFTIIQATVDVPNLFNLLGMVGHSPPTKHCPQKKIMREAQKAQKVSHFCTNESYTKTCSFCMSKNWRTSYDKFPSKCLCSILVWTTGTPRASIQAMCTFSESLLEYYKIYFLTLVVLGLGAKRSLPIITAYSPKPVTIHTICIGNLLISIEFD